MTPAPKQQPSDTPQHDGGQEIDEILNTHRSETWNSGWNNDATEKAKARLMALIDTAVIEELEAALTEYNRLQEHMSEPSRDLKFGNQYLLNRIAARTATNKEAKS